MVRVEWEFGKKRIIVRNAAGKVNKFHNRASIKDSASLVLKDTIVADSGSYSIRLTADDVPASANGQFLVIIKEQPTAKSNCSDLIVDRGKDVTCRCFNNGGNPPPSASWSKSSDNGTIGGEGYLEKILSLKNVSDSDSGTYVCKVQSHDLTDQVSISVKVKSAPVVTSFEADTEEVALGTSTTIACEALGVPELTYTISHNGTAVQIGKMYSIKSVRYEDAGQYECITSNFLGNSFKRLTLIVKAAESTLTSKTTPNLRTTGNTREVPDKSSNTTAWYLILIAFLCGILTCLILLFSVRWLKRRFSRQENNPTYSEPGRVSERNDDKCVDNMLDYAELNQQTRNAEDNYQSLQNKSRHTARHFEEPAAQESNYQELMDVRKLDTNYQSLNLA